MLLVIFMPEEIKSVEQFNDVVKQNKHVLVDFWAAWCGPCRMVSPVVEQLAELYKDKLKVVKVNVDEVSDLARQFGIMGIPTIMLFENGNVKDKVVGAMPIDVMKHFIDKNIS